MLHRVLPSWLRGSFVFLGYAINICWLAVLIYLFGLIKWIVPYKPWRNFWTRQLNSFPVIWTSSNTFVDCLFNRIDIKLVGDTTLEEKDWYLMLANHQSWADVILLYRVFNKRIPVLKFFMKSQLLWIPLLGWACWVIGYPFMKRYTKKQIAKNPELKGKDLETTKKMCTHFKTEPVTIMTFPEATRYTKAKAKKQQTSYHHLLKPRAGSLAYTLMIMGDYLQKILNVTIVYPQKQRSFWQYVSGQMQHVIIHVEQLPITAVNPMGDYMNDREARSHFYQWLNQLWQDKDKRIDQLAAEYQING